MINLIFLKIEIYFFCFTTVQMFQGETCVSKVKAIKKPA